MGMLLRKDIKDAAEDWTKKLDHSLTGAKEEFKKEKNSFTDGEGELKREVKNGKV